MIVTIKDTGDYEYHLFFDTVYKGAENEQIVKVPAADFICMQVASEQENNLTEIIEQNFILNEVNGPFILSNVFHNKYHLNSFHAEIQAML